MTERRWQQIAHVSVACVQRLINIAESASAAVIRHLTCTGRTNNRQHFTLSRTVNGSVPPSLPAMRKSRVKCNIAMWIGGWNDAWLIGNLRLCISTSNALCAPIALLASSLIAISGSVESADEKSNRILLQRTFPSAKRQSSTPTALCPGCPGSISGKEGHGQHEARTKLLYRLFALMQDASNSSFSRRERRGYHHATMGSLASPAYYIALVAGVVAQIFFTP